MLQPKLAGVVLDELTVARQGDEITSAMLQQLAGITTLFSTAPQAIEGSQPVATQAALQPAALAVVEANLNDLRQARKLLEQFGDKTYPRRQSMIIKNAALNAADLMKFQSVAEIMGF